MKFHLLIVDLRAYTKNVLFRKSFPLPICSRLPALSSIRFSLWSIWSWILCSVIRMALWGFFYMQPFSLTSNICLRGFLFFLQWISKIRCPYVCVCVYNYAWIFNSISLINMSVFVPITCLFLQLCSTIWNQECDTSWSYFIISKLL